MLSTTALSLKRCLNRSANIGAAVIKFKHTLPDLKYDFNALEPVISADIMRVHYEKHHNTYVNNLNVAEEKLAEAVAKGDTSAIISLQPGLKFNGGGVINHNIFWENLSPNGGGEPTGDLLKQIKLDFGSYEKMKSELIASGLGIQGSGWVWLGHNPISGRLRVCSCANQDPLQATTGLIPLFGIDVWEHAYYLQYKNMRADYLNAIFNIANWDDASNRLAKARMGK